SGEAKLFQVVGDCRVDLLGAGDVAADFSDGGADDGTHRARLVHRDWPTAGAQELENVQARRVSQCFEHGRDVKPLAFQEIHSFNFLISRNVEMILHTLPWSVKG